MHERFRAKLMFGVPIRIERIIRQREKKFISDLQDFVDRKLSEKETAQLVKEIEDYIDWVSITNTERGD
jgi:hypothetical protein